MDTTSLPASPARTLTEPQAAGLALGLLAVGMVGMRDGAAHMAGVWASSPTYTHGFLVPVVSAWLVWRGWRAGERLTGWPLALAGVAAAAAVYAVGSAVDARLLQHVGVSLYLVSGLAAVAGRGAATRHRFALFFLLFMVPFGEGAVPLLQLVTAKGIMAMTQAAGVLAFREGMLIETQAGTFNVARECAGLRFLVASLVTGALCAHLFFTSPKRQALMILAVLTLPVLANTLRAGATVLVADATDMQVAAGVDHLVYGWVFYAVILAVLCLAALRFAEDGAPRRPAPAFEAGPARAVPLGAAAGGFGLLAGLV